MNESILKYTVLKNYYIANKKVYEHILCECLNKSTKMQSICGDTLTPITNQSSGQSDVIAKKTGFSIDFKMMIAESYKEFLSRTAPIAQHLAPGVLAYATPPQLNKKVLLLWNCCRNMTEECLNELRLCKGEESKNVLHFYDKVINCSKNILIYLPVCYETLEQGLTDEERSAIIFSELSNTTKYIYTFRMQHQPDYKTYFVYLEKFSDCKINFVLSEFTSSGLSYIDSVDMFSLETVLQAKNENAIF